MGFDVEFYIHKNALTFDLIDETDIRNIITIIHELFERLERDASILNKPDLNEVFYFPFDTGSSKENLLITIKVRYRSSAKWTQTVSVQKAF